MSTENALLTILIEKINNDTITLPTLPEVAVRIRRAADDPDINLSKMADVIAQDPALSARMMKVANSAFHGSLNQGRNPQSGGHPHRLASNQEYCHRHGHGTAVCVQEHSGEKLFVQGLAKNR